jgi:hypothetical protein
MADKTIKDKFASTLGVLETKGMPYNAGYAERTFQPKNYFLDNARARLERIFSGVSATDVARSPNARKEQELGLIDSRAPDKQLQNKWGAVVDNVWGGRAETDAEFPKNTPDKAEGTNPTKASKEIAATAESLGALTAPVVNGVDGLVDEQKLAQAIHKVVETNIEGAVTAKPTTAFDAKQENLAVKEAAETTQMSEEERLQELKLQFEGIKEKITNNNTEGMGIENSVKVFEEYANALHNKIFDTKNADSITVMDITEYHEVTQYYEMYTGIRKQKEESETTTRTMTMQHA